MSPPLVLVRSWAVRNPGGILCQGRGCDERVPAGHGMSLVVRPDLARHDPEDTDARRYLCDTCIARVEDRVTRPHAPGIPPSRREEPQW